MTNIFKALILNKSGEDFTRKITDVDLTFLKHGEVLVKVDYSSVNFKDSSSP